MGRIANFFDGNFQNLNDAGAPNSGGYYKFYTAGVTSPTSADLKDTYPTRAAAIAQTPVNALNADNGVEIGSDGRPSSGNGIWLNGDYKVYCYDEDDIELWNQDFINADPLPGSSTIVDSLIKNGSFEDWTDNEPDNVTPVAASGATYERSTTSYHGGTAIKVVGAAAGGVTLTWDDYFEVSAGLELLCEFFIQCALASTNIVRLMWYTDEAGTAAGTPSTDIYNATAAVASYARKYGFATPPAGAKFAKIRSILSDTGGAVDTVYLDGIRVVPSTRNANALAVDGALTVAGAATVTGAVSAGGLMTAQGGITVGDASNQDELLTFHPSGTSATEISMKLVGWVKDGSTDSVNHTDKKGIFTSAPTAPGSNVQRWTLARAALAGKMFICVFHCESNGRKLKGVISGNVLDVTAFDTTTATLVSGVPYDLLLFEV